MKLREAIECELKLAERMKEHYRNQINAFIKKEIKTGNPDETIDTFYELERETESKIRLLKNFLTFED